MIKLNYLLMLFLLGIVITSCQRDELIELMPDKEYHISDRETNQINLRSFNQVDCGFNDAFCEKRDNRVLAHQEPVEPCQWPCFTGGGSDGSSSSKIILPVEIFDGTTAVYYDDGVDKYFIINSTHRAFVGKTVERKVSNDILQLLTINYRDITDGAKVLEDVQSSNLVSLTTLDDGKFRINTNNEGGTTSALIQLCDYYRTSDVALFITTFFDENVDFGEVVDLISEAYDAASNDSECSISGYTGTSYSKCRYNCIDPRCIVDHILNSFTDENTKNSIVARYIATTLNLPTEEAQWLENNANISFITDLYNQLGSDLDYGECDNEDCSMQYSIETIIGLEMSGQSSTMSISEQFEFYANLYCCDEPSLLDEVEDVKLNGYPNPTTDAILEGMSNMCCGENAMSQSEFASLMADQLNAELASIGESWPTSPEFFDDDFFEIMFEMMKEIVPELIPGVDTYIELKNAFEAYDNGNYWQSAESFAFAMLTVTPADKCKDFVKVFKTGRKGFKIFKLFGKLKSLSPALAKGFKKTLIKLQKNDHIFRNSTGHWPALKSVTKAVGGKENLVYNVYKKVFDSGIISTLITGIAKQFDIVINGVHIRGKIIKTADGIIRIDDFWIP